MPLTAEQIHTAADALVEAGERPTLAAVRRAVGGGSFTTISEAMQGSPQETDVFVRQGARLVDFGTLSGLNRPLATRLLVCQL